MQRSVPILFILVSFGALLASPSANAQSATPPPAAARAAEALGAARALLEQAAFEEEHERDFERAAKLFQDAQAQAELAEAEEFLAQAKEGRARCLSKLGQGAPRALPPQAYAQLGHADTLLYGDRLVPVLLEAIQTGQVVRPSGSPLMFSVESALAQLSRLDCHAAARAIDEVLSAPDPVLRLKMVRALYAESHQAHLAKALRDPVTKIRFAAREIVLRSPQAPLEPAVAEGLRDLVRAGWSDGIEFLRDYHPSELLPLARGEARARYPNLWPIVAAAIDKTLSGEAPFDPEAVRIVLEAVEAGHRDLVNTTLFREFAQSDWDLRHGPGDLSGEVYAGLERAILAAYSAESSESSPSELAEVLHWVAGQATVARALSPSHSVLLGPFVPGAYRAFAHDPRRLRAHREWLSEDPKRLGSATDWAEKLRVLARALSGRGTPETDQDLLALLELTLARFGAREGGKSALQAAVADAFSDPALASELEGLRTGLSIGFGLGARATYQAYLETPDDPSFERSDLLLTPQPFEWTPAALLDCVDRAHASRREEALRLALAARAEIGQRLGSEPVAELERALVSRFERGGRVAAAPALLSSLADNEAWLRVARGELAFVSTATAPALASQVMSRSPELAVELLPRAFPLLPSASDGLGSNDWLEDSWNELVERFPLQTEAAGRAALQRGQAALRGEGEWVGVDPVQVEILLRHLVGRHARGLELYREALARNELDPAAYHLRFALIERVGEDLPADALELFLSQAGDWHWQVRVLEAITRASYEPAIEYIERAQRAPQAAVRRQARLAVARILETREDRDRLAELKTGLARRELRELARLLEDADEEVAVGAARAIGRLGDPAALPVLVERLRGLKLERLKRGVLEAVDALTPSARRVDDVPEPPR